MSLFAVTATAVRFHTYCGYFGDEVVYKVRYTTSFPTFARRLLSARNVKRVSRNKTTSVLERCR